MVGEFSSLSPVGFAYSSCEQAIRIVTDVFCLIQAFLLHTKIASKRMHQQRRSLINCPRWIYRVSIYTYNSTAAPLLIWFAADVSLRLLDHFIPHHFFFFASAESDFPSFFKMFLVSFNLTLKSFFHNSNFRLNF